LISRREVAWVTLFLLLAPLALPLALGPVVNPLSIHFRGSAADRAIVRTVREHVYPTRLCEPFLCWAVLEVDQVETLAEPQRLIQSESLPLGRSARLPAVQTEGDADGLEVTCPAGAQLVGAQVRDRWWNPARSSLDGVRVTLCVAGNASQA
jgi:hypothetical protein